MAAACNEAPWQVKAVGRLRLLTVTGVDVAAAMLSHSRPTKRPGRILMARRALSRARVRRQFSV
jgi:hypothetical protein